MWPVSISVDLAAGAHRSEELLVSEGEYEVGVLVEAEIDGRLFPVMDKLVGELVPAEPLDLGGF